MRLMDREAAIMKKKTLAQQIKENTTQTEPRHHVLVGPQLPPPVKVEDTELPADADNDMGSVGFTSPEPTPSKPSTSDSLRELRDRIANQANNSYEAAAPQYGEFTERI